MPLFVMMSRRDAAPLMLNAVRAMRFEHAARCYHMLIIIADLSIIVALLFYFMPLLSYLFSFFAIVFASDIFH